MKVLVTGGAGRLGGYVLDELRGRHSLAVFDAVAAKADDVESVTGDIRSLEQVEAALDGCDAVIHLAAIPMYTGEEAHQALWEINSTGTFNVLEAAARRKVRRVVLASSICAQGFISWSRPFVPQFLPVDETHPTWPDDGYGLSKLIGEQLCFAYSRRYGIAAVCLRLATVWFPYLPDNTRKFVGRLDEPETMAGFIWNYVDARDAAQAFRLAIELPEVTYEVLNIGAANTCAKVPSLELIKRFYPEVPEIRNRSSFLTDEYAPLWDISRARRALGYEPRHTWQEYLELAQVGGVAAPTPVSPV